MFSLPGWYRAAGLCVFMAMGCGSNAELDQVDASADTGTRDSSPDTNTTVSPVACDPLAARPIVLTNVLGVGQDGQGTCYVADQPNTSTERVFVSVGDTLYRRHVGGSGSRGATGGLDYTLSYDDVDAAGIPSQALLLQVRSGVTTAMALAPAGSRVFIGDAGATYELLTVLDNGAVAGMKTRDLPHEVRYIVDLDATQQVVVTAPVGQGLDECRVFSGTKNDMVERPVTAVEFGGAMSSPTTTISFLVGSATQQILLTSGIFGMDAAPPDSGVNGPDPIAGYVFRCLES
jgi:hypothetical protein